MNKKLLALMLCVVTLATVAFALSRQAKSSESAQPRVAATPEVTAVNEYVIYSHVFHHIAFLKRKAQEEELKGRDGGLLRSLYKRQVEFSDDQSRLLDEIALSCVREVAQQDERAKRIIDRFRARYPGGRVPRGEQLPPPPQELQLMQQERNLIILRARDRLRTVLGEQAFARFDEFVKHSITLNVGGGQRLQTK